MTDLPGFPIDPLQPPPDAYDGVAARARSRRNRSALLAGGLALALGTVGVGTAALLGSSSSGDTLGQVATPAPTEPVPNPTPTALPEPSEVSHPTPQVSTSPPAPTASPAATDQPQDDIPVITGKVVDAAGKPVAGIYVYALTRAALDGASDTRTGPDGRFEVTCASDGSPSARVLLSSFEIGAARRPQPGPNHAFTWVGGGRDYSSAPAIPCNGARDTATTRMARGSTLTGRLVRVLEDGSQAPYPDHAVPGFGLYCERVLGIQGTQCAQWDPVGGRYTFGGLAAGTYQLTGMYASDLVAVGESAVVQRDWYEGDCCPQGRAPSGGSSQGSPSPTAPPSTTSSYAP